VIAVTNYITTTSTGYVPITVSPYSIGTITLSPAGVTIRDSHDNLEEKILEMLKRLAPPEYVELKCRECGGNIEQKWDDHIIKCPYCKTVYVVGRRMVNG
jgi:DNA-directed RNA polymerase subunit RPC12/RpoP